MNLTDEGNRLRHEKETLLVAGYLSMLPDPPLPMADELRDLPKISIVTPSYNQAKYLERTILSVLNQRYSNLEFIIVDGGSIDGSVEIIKKYERHIAYWHSKPDRGQSDALNYGFSKATGEIFGWLNSDDIYLPGAFASVVKAFCSRPQTGVVFGDWWEIDCADKVKSVNYAFDFSIGQFIYEGFHLNSQAMFWRRTVHQRIGEFDINLHRTMDYEMILRMGLCEGQCSFYRISQALGGFRRHAEQKTIGFDSRVIDEHRQIAKRNHVEVKYSFLGRVYRFGYRIRRAYWYFKRGGVVYAFARINDWVAKWQTKVVRFWR